ncbi:hypothetical protein QVD17_08580 [Tagetes erecta]|uniref:Uncharacterized protein n=1 Tax=Tagetes erecta TaxID=13708 RepID=A0AAD8P4N5_TARER|nr:hypothetical protein QVD17_08580 [Tagetes erecta]
MSTQCTHSGPCYGWINEEEEMVPAPPSYIESEPTEDESDQQQDSQSTNARSATLLEADDDVVSPLVREPTPPPPAPFRRGARTIMTPSKRVRPPQRIHLDTPTVDPIPAPLATPARHNQLKILPTHISLMCPIMSTLDYATGWLHTADYAGHTRIELNRLAKTVGDCRDEFLDLKEYTGGAKDHAIVLADDLWDTRADVCTIWRIVVMIIMVIFLVIVAALVCQLYY